MFVSGSKNFLPKAFAPALFLSNVLSASCFKASAVSDASFSIESSWYRCCYLIDVSVVIVLLSYYYRHQLSHSLSSVFF